MRTTIKLDDDVQAAVDELRRRAGLGVSEAVNRLLRQGLRASAHEHRPFTQRTKKLGLRLDVGNVAEALEILEGPAAR